MSRANDEDRYERISRIVFDGQVVSKGRRPPDEDE
jgi:hypothetical protein